MIRARLAQLNPILLGERLLGLSAGEPAICLLNRLDRRCCAPESRSPRVTMFAVHLRNDLLDDNRAHRADLPRHTRTSRMRLQQKRGRTPLARGTDDAEK